ncbi:MAG: DNA starvation/stationary phase protection protein [Bacteroidales bacterium]|nr:DNA starvation/stationary phase protection protein [Bacteroidales bacterium]
MNAIGLNNSNLEQVSNKLNGLLADYQIHYQNLRTMHWLVKGPNFFELHKAFESMYLDAAEKVDEIAERILIIGYQPLHTFSDYLDKSSITELQSVGNAGELIERVSEDILQLLKQEREIIRLAADASDEGTVAMLTEILPQQEKLLWMLSAMQN